MLVDFKKYDALGNDFLVIERKTIRLSRTRFQHLIESICDRRSGVGADGIVCLSPDRETDGRIDIYNADGSWAEKSGNGLRIAAVHCRRMEPRRRSFLFQTGNTTDRVTLGKRIRRGFITTTQLGQPDFEASSVPVRTRHKYLINTPLKFGPVNLPVTCLAVGNPHTVLVVDNFDFDWWELGADIEASPRFPRGTNVEFVQIISRRKLRVADWERGAGATRSSGTGAAAAVCATVMLGLANRRCEVQFEAGSLIVDWDPDSNIVELTGPAQFVMEGRYEFISR